MKITEFNSGIFEKQYEYKSFLPIFINRQWEINSVKLQAKLSEADRAISELNTFGKLIPNVDMFISMHIAKEANQSSRIEGTQTNFEEIFQKKEFIAEEKRDDWQEVQNYIKAINDTIRQLDKLPISTRLICEAHRILLDGARGERKSPGEYRKSQNWIGPSLKDAYYVPPHYERIAELMNDLEKFINNTEIYVPELVKIAIVHYQFETIHPFLDGNGRIGRLLITLYLVSSGLLIKPSLYLSDFFERNRIDYYDNLTRVRTQNDLENWLNFFLAGVIEVSKNSIDIFKNILNLKDDIEKNKIMQLSALAKRQNAYSLMNLLYRNPIITIGEASEHLKVHFNTAKSLIKDFQKLEILIEQTGYKRNQEFVFLEYLSVLSAHNLD